MGAHAIEQTSHHGRRGCRKDESGNDAYASKRDSLEAAVAASLQRDEIGD